MGKRGERNGGEQGGGGRSYYIWSHVYLRFDRNLIRMFIVDDFQFDQSILISFPIDCD